MSESEILLEKITRYSNPTAYAAGHADYGQTVIGYFITESQVREIIEALLHLRDGHKSQGGAFYCSPIIVNNILAILVKP